MAKKKTPTEELSSVSEDKTRKALQDLLPLALETGQFPPFVTRTADVEQIRDRIALYFNYCAEKGIRPGMEGMALALHTTRRTLERWVAGTMRPELQDTIIQAKQMLAAYLEYVSLNGQIFPATAIFLMKNWFGYKDQTEQTIEVKPARFGEDMTDEQIANMIDAECEDR